MSISYDSLKRCIDLKSERIVLDVISISRAELYPTGRLHAKHSNCFLRAQCSPRTDINSHRFGDHLRIITLRFVSEL